MNSFKLSRLVGLAVIPLLAAGLIFIKSNMDRSGAKNPASPGIVTPGDRGSGPPSVAPDNGGPTKIEYRNVLYNPRDGG